MPPFERHVFVCTNQREKSHPRGCCAASNGVSVREAMKARSKALGLEGKVRINATGCLDQCEHGTTVVVYPEGVWYGFVGIDDVEEIVQLHLVKGEPVARLRLPDNCINTAACSHRAPAGIQLGGLR